MANTSRVLITINSILDDRQADTLRALAAENGLHPEGSIADLTPADLENGTAPTLENTDAIGGEVLGFEAWLVSEKLRYVRETEGRTGDWLPERVVFDGTGTTSCQTNKTGEPVVTADDVAELGTVEAILAYLERHARRPDTTKAASA